MTHPSRPLRIAHLQPLTLDLYGHEDTDFGRTARYFLPNMVTAQAHLGHLPTVHILTSGAERMMEVDGVPVHFHACVQPPRSSSPDVRFARQLSVGMLRIVHRDTADVIHFHGIRSLHTMYAAVAWRAARARVPLVGQDHGPRSVGPVVRAAQRYAIRHTARALAANSEGVEVLHALGAPRDIIEVVPNGVDQTIFYPGPRRVRDQGAEFRILVVARLFADKDPLTMAAGIAEVSRRGARVTVTIVSRGPLRDQVASLLREAAVPTEFIDHIPQSELAELYRQSDALVLTSLREGFNQATVEAMGCGLPVIATDIPGIRDGVGDAGLLIPTRSPSALADALQHLIEHPDACERHRDLGLERVRMFDWNAIAQQLIEAYARARAVVNGTGTVR